MRRIVIHLLFLATVTAILPVSSTADTLNVPLVAPQTAQAKLDYSYCRFDSTEKAICEAFLPSPVYLALANATMHPRLVPAFLTMEDARLVYADDTLSGKIMYGSEGRGLAYLGVFRKDETGVYVPVWDTQEVPPAGNVKVQLRDLTGDGRPEIVATARGGTPVREAMAAFDFDGKVGHPVLPRSKALDDTNGMLGIGIGIIDSLGPQGFPLIEVWQDDPAGASGRFLRIRHKYSADTKMYSPATIDTLTGLPRWCAARRPR